MNKEDAKKRLKDWWAKISQGKGYATPTLTQFGEWSKLMFGPNGVNPPPKFKGAQWIKKDGGSEK